MIALAVDVARLRLVEAYRGQEEGREEAGLEREALPGPGDCRQISMVRGGSATHSTVGAGRLVFIGTGARGPCIQANVTYPTPADAGRRTGPHSSSM